MPADPQVFILVDGLQVFRQRICKLLTMLYDVVISLIEVFLKPDADLVCNFREHVVRAQLFNKGLYYLIVHF